MKMTTRVADWNCHYPDNITAVRNPINRKRYGGSELCGNQ